MSIHWTAAEIERLMFERGLDMRGLSALSGVSYDQIRKFFNGTCVLTLTNIERLAEALGHDMELVSNGSPNPAIDCPYCGRPVIPVSVHGHTQCPKCTAILERCCED